jgi:hypothetical protein
VRELKGVWLTGVKHRYSKKIMPLKGLRDYFICKLIIKHYVNPTLTYGPREYNGSILH